VQDNETILITGASRGYTVCVNDWDNTDAAASVVCAIEVAGER
jgi:hypothetical protein